MWQQCLHRMQRLQKRFKLHWHSKCTQERSGAALSMNIFDYRTKGTADQMGTSWEKLVQYIGTNYGQDISNEL